MSRVSIYRTYRRVFQYKSDSVKKVDRQAQIERSPYTYWFPFRERTLRGIFYPPSPVLRPKFDLLAKHRPASHQGWDPDL